MIVAFYAAFLVAGMIASFSLLLILDRACKRTGRGRHFQASQPHSKHAEKPSSSKGAASTGGYSIDDWSEWK